MFTIINNVVDIFIVLKYLLVCNESQFIFMAYCFHPSCVSSSIKQQNDILLRDTGTVDQTGSIFVVIRYRLHPFNGNGIASSDETGGSGNGGRWNVSRCLGR